MKSIEKLALALIILYFFNFFAQYPFSSVVGRGFSPRWDDIHYLTTIPALSPAQSVLRGAVTTLANIAVAVWLFNDARRNSFKEWIWGSLGLLYGITALIIYVLQRLFLELKAAKGGTPKL